MKPKFITSPEANRRIAELEAIVAKNGTGPTNSAPHRAPIAAALQAKVDAGKAALAAAEAKVRAKQAAAAIQPATVTAQGYLASIARPTMNREEFNRLPHSQRGEVIKRVTLVP